LPLPPDGANKEPFEGTPRFSGCTTFLFTTRQIALGWRVDALLGERDLMEQPIQTAIPLTVEPVPHAAGAGSFQRCNTGQGGKLRFTQAWPRRSKLGNQGCRCQWTQASDGLERGEPPRDSALELAVELLLLVCQQRQLCGHLPNRLFAVAGKDTLARRGVGLACADACPGGQIRDARFVRRIAQQQQSVQPIADAGHIGDHVLTEPAPELDRGDRLLVGQDKRQGRGLLAHETGHRQGIQAIALTRLALRSAALSSPLWRDLVDPLPVLGLELGHTAA